MGLISLREFARRNGISAEAVSKAVKTGRIPAHDGKLDPTEAQAAWDRSKDPARAGRKLPRASWKISKMQSEQQRVPAADRPQSSPAPFPSGFGGHSYTEVKTRREQVRLARDQFELKRLIGDMVPVADVGQKIDAMIYTTRSKLLSLGHKLAPRLAIETDATRCQEVVDEAVREILADLAACRSDHVNGPDHRMKRGRRFRSCGPKASHPRRPGELLSPQYYRQPVGRTAGQRPCCHRESIRRRFLGPPVRRRPCRIDRSCARPKVGSDLSSRMAPDARRAGTACSTQT